MHKEHLFVLIFSVYSQVSNHKQVNNKGICVNVTIDVGYFNNLPVNLNAQVAKLTNAISCNEGHQEQLNYVQNILTVTLTDSF